MSASLDSSISQKLPTRSKTLPALPTSDEQNVENDVSLSRSYTIGATGTSKHSMDMNGHVKSIGEGNDGEAEAEAEDEDESKDGDHHPRKRSTSGQQSINRDYFVYADSASSPTIQLRKPHPKSKTIHATHSPRSSSSPDIPARFQSLGAGSSYTRVRVDDGSFWKNTGDQDSPDESQRQYGAIITPTTDNDTKNTLPTIPGSSASSDTQSQPPAVPEKEPPPYSIDATYSPTISPPIKFKPRGPSSKRRSSDRPPRREITRINTSTEPHKHNLAQQLDLSPDSSNTIEAPKPHHQSATEVAPGHTSLSQFLIGTRFFEGSPPVSDSSSPESPRKVTSTSTHTVKEGSTRPSNHDPSPLPKSGRSDFKAAVAPKSPLGRPSRDETHSSHQPLHPGRENEHDEETGQNVTRYMRMLLALDKIPRIHNLSASFFTWILLAGFVLFPGTFTSLRNSGLDTNSSSGITGEVVRSVLNGINHIPLFVIAFLCCGIGASGMSYLWWRWMNNYLWLVNKIFLPGLMNSFAGVISALSSIYGAQQGEFSLPSKVTLIVTATAMFICGVLTAFYMLWMIRNVKLEHDRIIGKQRTGRHGEGFIERIKRKANEESGPGGGFVGF